MMNFIMLLTGSTILSFIPIYYLISMSIEKEEREELSDATFLVSFILSLGINCFIFGWML